MNPEAERMCEEIDAALFSGDTFLQDEETILKFKEYLDRWNRWVADHVSL